MLRDKPYGKEVRKMKKIRTILLTFLSLVMLWGCVSRNAEDKENVPDNVEVEVNPEMQIKFDAQKVVDELIATISVPDLYPMQVDDFTTAYSLDSEKIEQFVGYNSQEGSSLTTLIVVKVKSSEDVLNVKNALVGLQGNLLEEYKGSGSEDEVLVKESCVGAKGTYIYFFCCSDAMNVEAKFLAQFEVPEN